MKIVFMGTPKFAVPILEMLIKEHQVVLVVSQPDKPVGRKRLLKQSLVKQLAIKNNIAVFQPVVLKKEYQKIIELAPDMIITAAYGQMLPKELLDAVTALNVHGSLLPKHRGGAPIQYALFEGLKQTGVTVMYMALKMDSGDIIKQAAITIDSTDNYLSLSNKLSILGANVLNEVLCDLEKGIIERFPQDEQKASVAYTLKRKDEKICFHQRSCMIINRIQGLSPEPGAFAEIKKNIIKVYAAQESDIIDSSAVAGTILLTKKKLIVATKDGAIEILEIQAPGKRRMKTRDFLNGQTILKENDIFNRKD